MSPRNISCSASFESMTAWRCVFSNDDLLAARGEAFERRGEGEPVRERLVECVSNVVRNTRPHPLQEDGGSHGDAEPQDRLVRLLDRVSVLERIHEHRRRPAQETVDD